MAPLAGGDFGHAAHGELARGVGDRAGAAAKAGGGGDVDHRAGALGDHLGTDGFHAEPDADLVDLDDQTVGGLIHLGDRRVAVDAGVVDQRIEPAVIFDDVGDERVPGVLIGHVEPAVGCGVADCGGGARAFFVEHIGEDHARAFGGEQFGFGGALSARRAGDQRHFSIESTGHLLAPRVASEWVWRGV